MKSSVVIRLPDGSTQQVELTSDAYRIGRHPENEIVVSVQVASRSHARLERRGEEWWYIDLDSRNGTFLNGERIRSVKLQDGMSVQIGQKREQAATLIFHLSAEPVTPSKPPASVFETVLEKPTSSTGYVRLQPPPPSRARNQIIGRGGEADIQLPAPVVSRRHASLQEAAPDWILTDLGSKNGTFLNGKRIIRPERLRQGDVIQIGPFRMVYEGQGKLNRFVASRGLHLDGKDLTFVVDTKKGRKKILSDINISINPQEFVALVGGSGAGKSTLMKALSGLLPVKGHVLVEGEELYSHFEAYRSMIGYVPQDDILHQELTVQEALEYSARLRLPPDTEEAEIKTRIDRALGQVELTSQRNQVINSLSGGQRKRASIAVELLADPPLFFLDEPTSGLDPGLEKKVMLILRKLAESGKTVVLVTHATANITECHQVAFLSEGRLLYYGPPRQACKFFEVDGEDFAEIYSRITDPDPQTAKQRAETWERKFRLSEHFQEIQKRFQITTRGRVTAGIRSNKERFSLLGSIHQFLLLAKRYFSLILHDKPLFYILLLVMPLLALLILGISEPNWLVGNSEQEISQQLIKEMASGQKSASYFAAGGGQKLLFIMSLTAVMLGLFASSYEIVKERTIYKRERMVFLQLVPYLGSKIIPLALIAAVQCFLFLLIIRLHVDFPSTGVFLPFFMEAYITLFLAVVTSIGMGLFISSLAKNQNIVTYFILGILFLQITFAGVIFELPGIAKPLSSLTLTRWSMQALGASVKLDELDKLSRTRFQPDAITEEVEVDIEKPDPDWEPVIINTEQKQIPGCKNPVPMPVVSKNEMVLVKEKVRQAVTIKNPKPVEIPTSYEFTLKYDATVSHLMATWTILVVLFLSFFMETLAVLKWRKLE